MQPTDATQAVEALEPQVFFDAVGDEKRLAAHTSHMAASTSAFLDYGRLDVIPTSRYSFG